jgi:hypothetical protein
MKFEVGQEVVARWFNASYSSLRGSEIETVEGQARVFRGTVERIFRNNHTMEWTVEIRQSDGSLTDFFLHHVVEVLPVLSLQAAVDRQMPGWAVVSSRKDSRDVIVAKIVSAHGDIRVVELHNGKLQTVSG